MNPLTDETAYNYVDNRGNWESACQHFEIERRNARRSLYRRTIVAAFGAFLLIWLFSGCGIGGYVIRGDLTLMPVASLTRNTTLSSLQSLSPIEVVAARHLQFGQNRLSLYRFPRRLQKRLDRIHADTS